MIMIKKNCIYVGRLEKISSIDIIAGVYCVSHDISVILLAINCITLHQSEIH